MTKRFTICALVACCLTASASLQAQTGRPANKPATADTSKRVVLQPRFGPYKGDIPAIAADLQKVLGNELVVTDQRGDKWTVLAWRLGWRKKEFSDDWRTGKRKTIFTFNATDISKSARIPEGWQQELKESLKKDEELLFEQIIVEHPKTGVKMMAPSFTLKVGG